MLSRCAPLALLVLAGAFQPASADESALSADDLRAIHELRREGRFDEALARLDDHAAVVAGAPEALALRGLVLLDAGRDGAARVILARAFRTPRVIDAAVPNLFLGRMNLSLGEPKRAKARLEAAQHYDPENAEAAFLRDAASAAIDGDAKAILALRSFDRKEDLPKGLLENTVGALAREVGTARALEGRSDEDTWALLRTALDRGDDDADVQLHCARVLHRRGEQEAAEELLDDVAKRRPHRMQDVLYERGLAQHERGEDEKAYETLNGSLVLGKDHADVLTLASTLALDLGKLEDANRLLSLLEARVVSPEVDRLYSRYCLLRAEAIPADDEKQRGNRIVLLREAEKRCISSLKQDALHVESLERLLRVSELLGDRSEIERDRVTKQLENAQRIAAHRARTNAKSGS